MTREYVRHGGVAALMLTLGAGVVPLATSVENPEANTELRQLIEELQARVTQAEAENRRLAGRVAELESAAGIVSSVELEEEVVAMGDDVAGRDAEASSLEGTTELVFGRSTSGYSGPAFLGAAGSGFFVGSEDGAFRLTTGGYLQTRYVYNHVEDDGSGGSDNESGFTVPRARLWFGGQAFNKWNYFLRGDFRGVASQSIGETDPTFSTVGGRFQLDTYFLSYGGPFDPLSVKVGQFPSNLHREQWTEPHAKATQDNSPVATLFDSAVFQGVELNWNSGNWRNSWVLSNGQRSVSRNFDDPRNADFAIAQRTEYIFAEDPDSAWMQLYNFTGRPGDDFAARVAGSLLYEAGREAAPGIEFDVLQAGVELSAEGDGWYGFGRGDYWRTDWRSPGVTQDDFGVSVQGGFYVTRKHEVYGRLDGVFPDPDRDDDGVFRAVTLGFTYYPVDGPGFESLKLGIEGAYYFDPVSGSLVSPSNSLGLRNSPAGDQFMISGEVGFLW